MADEGNFVNCCSIANREASDRQRSESSELVEQLRERVATLDADEKTVRRRLARETDDLLYETLRGEYQQIRADRDAAHMELDRHQQQARQVGDSPDEQVDLALELYDNMLRIMNDPAARAEIPALLDGLGMRVGLNFIELTKGTKRPVRHLAGGIVTFGDHPLPVPIHGTRNREPDSNVPIKNQSRRIESNPGPLRRQKTDVKHHASDEGNVCPTEVNASDNQKLPGIPGQNQRESVSSTKGQHGGA